MREDREFRGLLGFSRGLSERSERKMIPSISSVASVFMIVVSVANCTRFLNFWIWGILRGVPPKSPKALEGMGRHVPKITNFQMTHRIPIHKKLENRMTRSSKTYSENPLPSASFYGIIRFLAGVDRESLLVLTSNGPILQNKGPPWLRNQILMQN